MGNDVSLMTEGHLDAYQHCQVLTTTGSRQAAEALSRAAVELRLAACGQILGPLTSCYRWAGRIETAEEWQVLFKTTAGRYPALEAYLVDHHGYEVPEVLCLPVVAGNPAYLAWVRAETGG